MPIASAADALILPMNPKSLLRWATVVLFGGLGLYVLGAAVWATVRHPGADWLVNTVNLVFTLLFACLPLTVAYLAYQRWYRSLAKLVTGIAAFVLFGVLATGVHALDRSLDLHHSLELSPSSLRGQLWPLLGLLLDVSPLLIIVWLLGRATRLIDRYVKEPEPTEAQQASALRWHRRSQSLHRGVLRAGVLLAEAMVLVAVLAFVGALVWIWRAPNDPDAARIVGLDPFGLGFTVLVSSLLVFVVGLLARGDWRTRLREISAVND